MHNKTAILEYDLVREICDLVKEALSQHIDVTQRTLIRLLKKKGVKGADPLLEFANSVVEYFKKGKLEWDDISPLEKEIRPGYDIIPFNFLRNKLSDPSLRGRFPPTVTDKLMASTIASTYLDRMQPKLDLIKKLIIVNAAKQEFKSRIAADKDLASVVIRHPKYQDYILHGLRKDNRKWSLPGGHANPNEDPMANAVRECYEETGLECSEADMNFLHSDLVEVGEDLYTISLFELPCPEELILDAKNDPDSEFCAFKFLDPRKLPDEQLHVPKPRSSLVKYLMMKNPLSFEEAE